MLGSYEGGEWRGVWSKCTPSPPGVVGIKTAATTTISHTTLSCRLAFTGAHAALLSESLGTDPSVPVLDQAAAGVASGSGGRVGGGDAAAALMGEHPHLAGAHAPGGASEEAQAAAVQQRQQHNATVLRRLLAASPGAPQAMSPSPLLDPLLFAYDEKSAGPLIRCAPRGEREGGREGGRLDALIGIQRQVGAQQLGWQPDAR